MKNVDKKRSISFCLPCFGENGLAVGEEEWLGVQPFVSPAVNMASDDKDKDVGGSFSRKNKLDRRSFSHYVKAVLFDISLKKKMRDQKFGQKSSRNYSSAKSKPKKIFNSKSANNIPSMINNNNNNPSRTEEDNHSTPCPSFSCCSCTTSVATNSSSSTTASRCSSMSESVEYSKQVKVRNNGFNVGICSFLISLLVLVISGKVFAIICTSTWLFFAFRRRTIKIEADSSFS